MDYKLKKFFFLIGDIIVLHVALATTLFIRYRLIDNIDGISPFWRNHWFYFGGVFFIFILVFYINNLYSLRQMASARLFVKKTISSVIIASLLSIIYFYAYPRIDITPKTNLIIFTLLSIFFFLIWRRIAYWLISSDNWQNKLAVIGYDTRIEELIKSLENRPGLGYKSVIVFKESPELTELEASIKKDNIRLILINNNYSLKQELQETLFKLLQHRVSFISYEDFYEQIHAKVPVESINVNWFLDNLKEGEKNYFDALKNIFDKIFATILFIITLPFWPIIAIIIKLDSSGGIFFTQNRLGKNAKVFKLYKFRSMEGKNNDGGMTEKEDRRITKFGSFIRKTRIDEMPQLINILKGQMSFIGPRPERPELAKELSLLVPFYNTRLLIKPGLSGWDQVSGEYHSPTPEDTLKKLQNDLYYIKNRSLYLDISIIFKTLSTVLGRRGR